MLRIVWGVTKPRPHVTVAVFTPLISLPCHAPVIANMATWELVAALTGCLVLPIPLHLWAKSTLRKGLKKLAPHSWS